MEQLDLKLEPGSILAQGLAELDLGIDEAHQSQLLDFLKLLEKWNKTYNLTAIRDRREMVVRHLLDSLSIMAHIVPGRVLDVGSGAGIPGIPLAINMPDCRFVLLDSNGKKQAFMRAALRELQLDNVSLLQARAEALDEQPLYDCMVCRAFSSLDNFLALAARLLAKGGRAVYMTGQAPGPGLLTQGGFSPAQVVKLAVPGLDAQRHLLIFERKQAI